MCETCGCGEPGEPRPHSHPNKLTPPARVVRLQHDVLSRNAGLAARNRDFFASRHALALNLLSSPGSGKTTLLERTIRDLRAEMSIVVIEGDQATTLDADRIRAAGAPVVQINTGTGCHLDAEQISRALTELDPAERALVLVENVGNLVCPALFDLGEDAKVVLASPTDGEDKPLKYPHIFKASQLVLLNKIDLMPHLRFDLARFAAHVGEVAPRARVLHVSATTGEGLDAWYGWIRERRG